MMLFSKLFKSIVACIVVFLYWGLDRDEAFRHRGYSLAACMGTWRSRVQFMGLTGFLFVTGFSGRLLALAIEIEVI